MMKKIRFILAAFIIYILFVSCKAKVVHTETHTIDTIKVEKIIKIKPSQLNSIKIENVCDSLGKLKTFKYIFGSGKDKTVLKMVNNTVYLEQNIDSIKQETIKEYKSSIKDSESLTIKTKTPKWVWYSLLINLLLLIWIFRKFIPFFKFIPF